ncbi:hypothetical protein [Longimicrobium terrae]|uniref:Uncharacterized protein n=1 Tax=Longimicrobium terrae TaxID=1639882 RepID=A0A841H1U5_9BACT|nr:hypothetical protein [Longimicrobium terrae]MBB4637583.1 hypothetical protein [Longimicrobium terrae]MBB6071980.1 hypothetical protein [Longimicrobium terrae]NNC30524.1 hypothetical protein [Longimicrobium terrae]
MEAVWLASQNRRKRARGAAARHLRRRERCWRLGLRDGRFLDRRPPPSEVPDALVVIVTSAFPLLIEEWDRKYPHNPVSSGAHDG